MNAAKAVMEARAAGILLGVEGDDLVLEASSPPSPAVLDLLLAHKAAVVSWLRPGADGWSAEDWQAFFDERAGIAEFKGGRTRVEAEAFAFESCIVEWLNRHTVRSDPGHCACCGKPDSNGHAVIPFGTESHGHAWLHPECWTDWHQDRREMAQQALAAIGLDTPPKCTKGAKFPGDFRKTGGGETHG